MCAIVYLPTTSKSFVAISVWKDGASALTSHEYFPDTDGCTWAKDTWLSFDPERCKKNKKIGAWKKNSWKSFLRNAELIKYVFSPMKLMLVSVKNLLIE